MKLWMLGAGLLLGALVTAHLQAATITIIHADDAGKEVSRSVITTTDPVLTAFSTQMAVQITRMMEREKQAQGVNTPTPPAVAPTVADSIKALVAQRLPRPDNEDAKSLQIQINALQQKLATIRAAMVK